MLHPQNPGKLPRPHCSKVEMKLWAETQRIETPFQIRKRVWLLLGATLPFFLLMPWTTNQVGAQTPGSKTSPPAAKPPLKPIAKPWQPDEFQRAMVLGTTMPNDLPLPTIPLDPHPPAASPPLPEIVPPIFRKPLPIISPAKTPPKKTQ